MYQFWNFNKIMLSFRNVLYTLWGEIDIENVPSLYDIIIIFFSVRKMKLKNGFNRKKKKKRKNCRIINSLELKGHQFPQQMSKIWFFFKNKNLDDKQTWSLFGSSFFSSTIHCISPLGVFFFIAKKSVNTTITQTEIYAAQKKTKEKKN